MYALIETGGKQHRVQVGDLVQVERLPGEAGSVVVFERVLLVRGEESVRVGSPVVPGASVRGSIVSQGRGKKVRIRTYKRRENASRNTMGHRQHLTSVRIEAIEG